VTITAMGPSGIGVDVDLAIDNPNGIELRAKSVTANVVLDGTYTLTTVTVSHELALAPRAKTRTVVPMTIPWQNVSTLLALGAANRDIPYDLDGSVTLGSDALSAAIPFHLHALLTREQIVNATINSFVR